MVPLLFVQEIPDCNIRKEMKIYKKKTGRKTLKGTKKLLGVLRGKNVFLIKWYLKYGLRLTAVHQLVEYEPSNPFSWFSEEVANARREADKHPTKK